ncbi:Zinc finger protein [Plakobranchus ocellatus]|uniref:Zinc finger protein n=1 Tax=Plakobranchus ocellatus TaxID=259542 RepID=A0AAV4C0N3_9GAST|nr:Zinc finger protein [Plakobranchus ocellatus]
MADCIREVSAYSLFFVYREVPQKSTRFAAFDLLYERTICNPMHILRDLWTKEIQEPNLKSSYEFVLNLRDRLDDTLQIARDEIQKAQTKQKHYNQTARRRTFCVGYKVLIFYLPSRTSCSCWTVRRFGFYWC